MKKERSSNPVLPKNSLGGWADHQEILEDLGTD